MPTNNLNAPEIELDDFVEAFEAAQACEGRADLARFLPEPGHPLYGAVLRELVRVDMEYGWARGQPRRLKDYLRSFPVLADDVEGIREIAFEESRLRQEAAENPSPAEHRQPWGVSARDWLGRSFAPEPSPRDGDDLSPCRELHDGQTADPAPSLDDQPQSGFEEVALAYQEFRWQHTEDDPTALHDYEWCSSFRSCKEHAELFREVHRSDPQAAHRLAQAITSMPKAGTEFYSFRLLAELGQGAFAKVFLAEQAGLANRHVVLKISTNLLGESQKLAQLQHTNIVPIYSVHQAGPFQAICMPYFGATTLGHIIRALRKGASLPLSGKMLVSTVNRRNSATWPRTGKGLSGLMKRPDGLARTSEHNGEDTQASAQNGEAAATLKMLEGLTYDQTVLWIGARLADGLAHAHARGILHGDLKPANILLTDEGQPMLLDFNLSEDTKLRSTAADVDVGGTLPYMAPEHIDAFQGGMGTIDGRSDVYSLGVILYELLTGCHPFPAHRGPMAITLPRLLEDRRRPSPRLRPGQKTISPAVESIVHHCLEPDPGKRYQAAHELREDLERQLSHLPLRYASEPSLRERAWKWKHRHPLLTSPISVGLVAATLLLVGGGALFLVRGQRLAHLEALNSLTQFRDEMKTTQCLLNAFADDGGHLEEGIDQCQLALGRYRILENPAWQQLAHVRTLPDQDRRRLAEDVGELLLLLARATASLRTDHSQPANGEERVCYALRLNEIAETCYPKGQAPQALWVQRAELAQQFGQEAEAHRLLAKARGTPFRTARDRYLTAGAFIAHGEFRQALPLLQEAVRQDPQDFGACFLLGICHFGLGRDAEALACYTTCIALWPNSSWAYFNRGVMYLRQGEYHQAGADFDQVIRLRPDIDEPYLNRALARQGLNKYTEAVADLTRAMDLGTSHTRAYFMRARVKELLGDREGAGCDIAEGLRLEPSGEKDWIARGVARLSRDPEAALADFSGALKCNDRSRAALQNLAHVLAERLGRTREAVAVLDRAVTHYPDHVPTRAGRGVLLARLKQGAAAHRDAEEALSHDRTPPTLYQVASIYALTSCQYPEDRREALQLLSSALRKGYGLHLIDADKDWDALREDPEFRRLVEAARALHPDEARDSTKRESGNGISPKPEEKGDSQRDECTHPLKSSATHGYKDGES